MSILIAGADYDLLLEVLQQFSREEILGYTSNVDHFYKELPYLGDLRDRNQLDPQTKLIMASSDIAFRKFMASRWSNFMTEFVSTTATFLTQVELRMGTTIGMHALVSGNCYIGMMSSIGAFARLHHGSVVEDYSVISPGSTLLGDSRVSFQCIVGANATVLPKVTVANNCIVGAGAVVVKNTQPFGVYAGNPARLIRMTS